MTKVLVSAAALAFFSGSALAADLPAFEPAPIVAPLPAFSWTGFYAGVDAGWAWGEAELNIGNPDDEEFDVDGWLAGGFIGYNRQFSSLVVGIEADLEATGIDGDGSDPILGDFDADVGLQGSVRGRLGFAAGRLLPYVTGGIAAAGVDASSDARGSDDSVEWGWTAGAGADLAVTDRVFIRGEYRYSDLSDFDNDDGPAELQDLRTHAVRLGVGILFH
jgi:outer membrane immunogenic protein